MALPNDTHAGAVGTGTTTTFPTHLIGSNEYPVGIAARYLDGALLDGSTRLVTVTPTISTSIYASGDEVGGLMTFTSILPDAVLGGQIVSAAIVDKAAQNAALDLFIYDRSITVAADNAATSVSDADALFCQGVISFSAGNYASPGANSIAVRSGVGIAVKANASGHLYGHLVVRGTPTYAATSDIQVTLAVKAD